MNGEKNRNVVSESIKRWREIWNRATGRGTYPHQFAFLLLIPLRRFILSPSRLVARLHLTETSRVLELGPGPGFFSPEVARSVPRGRLFLIDLQREMLEKARRRIHRAGITNVSFAQASASALPVCANVFDVAFLVAVLGEVPDPIRCVESLRHSLRPGGFLSITELPGDPDALSESEVAALARASQLQHVETYPIRGGFTVNFRKPADAG